MMVLILDTGLRISEVMDSARTSSISKAGVLRVMGKGGKERQVPFGSRRQAGVMELYGPPRRRPGQDLFFVSRFGGRLLSLSGCRRPWSPGKQVGLQGVRVSPHTLRHTFATPYIKNGGDAFSLQKILGHSTLDMVRIYVRLADQEVALLHRRFSPMDRMGIVPGGKRRVLVQ